MRRRMMTMMMMMMSERRVMWINRGEMMESAVAVVVNCLWLRYFFACCGWVGSFSLLCVLSLWCYLLQLESFMSKKCFFPSRKTKKVGWVRGGWY